MIYCKTEIEKIPETCKDCKYQGHTQHVNKAIKNGFVAIANALSEAKD